MPQKPIQLRICNGLFVSQTAASVVPVAVPCAAAVIASVVGFRVYNTEGSVHSKALLPEQYYP